MTAQLHEPADTGLDDFDLDVTIIESGPEDDPVLHARLRRDTVHLWTLEMATHTGRWERTGFRDQRDKLLDLLVTTFPWIVAARE